MNDPPVHVVKEVSIPRGQACVVEGGVALDKGSLTLRVHGDDNGGPFGIQSFRFGAGENIVHKSYDIHQIFEGG